MMSAAERWEAPILRKRAVSALATAPPAARLKVGRAFDMPEWVTLAMRALEETPLTKLTEEDFSYILPSELVKIVATRSSHYMNRYSNNGAVRNGTVPSSVFGF
jgi:hypothetical protein